MASSVQPLVLLILLGISVDIALSNDRNVAYRLPNNTAPEHYHIQITTKLDKDDFKFSGICTITIKVLEETDEIVLHSKLSDIRGLELLDAAGKNITLGEKGKDLNTKNEFLTIHLKQKLTKEQTYKLKIWYFSELRTDKLGFYRSSYTDHLGSKVWLAATQFAPTEARHAFPCYDEPNRKATFQLEIRHPSELTAISGTGSAPPKINSDGTAYTAFPTTEKMSTYLLGFVVSNFNKVLSQTPDVLHELYVRPNRLLMGQHSARLASTLMSKLAEYFDEKFPQTLMKHVALPDFYFSGMENWGIVTYKERTFLYDPSKHSMEMKMGAISLIGHEMAHSWFGNLVTMEWWTYVWLKEGFSTLYAYYGAQKAWPSENYMELFLIKKMHPVLTIDGTTKTRPMTRYIEKQGDIMTNYDKIAYNKAASILRMFEHAFGRDIFKKAVNMYLTKYKFKNADEKKLIDCFTEAVKKYPAEIVEKNIKSWTNQKGFPVITVTKAYPPGTSITLTQERFLNSGDLEKAPLWRIPVNFKKSNSNDSFDSTTPDFWMTERTLKLTSTISGGKNVTLDPTEWIIFNKQQTGFYRVNYYPKNWELLIQALKHNHRDIHVLNRAQLIDDSFALAAAGRLNYSVPLKLIGYMHRECYYAPWAALKTHFNDFKRHLHYSTLKLFSKYILKIAVGYVEKLGRPDDSSDTGDGLTSLTNKIVYELICKIDAKRCLQGVSIRKDPNTRYLDYCFLVQKAEKNAYLELRGILRNEEDLNVRADILSSFGCSNNKEVLSFILSSTIENPSDLKLTDEERKDLLEAVYLKGELGLEMAMQFISHEWKSLYHLLPNLLNEVIPDMAKYVQTEKSKQKFDIMVESIRVLRPDTVITAKTEVTNNLRWTLLYENNVNVYLKSSSASAIVSVWTVILLCILAL